MQTYHYAWLSAHPNRDEDWLKLKLKEGFDIHHLDGDHSNHDPTNLVLIDAADHMMLHNGKKRMSRVMPGLKVGRPRKKTVEFVGPPKPEPVSTSTPARQKKRKPFTLHDRCRLQRLGLEEL